MADTSDSYKESIGSTHEPALELPESDKKEVEKKIKEEERAASVLETAADVKITSGGYSDASFGTGQVKVPTKDKYGTVQVMTEEVYDRKLLAKSMRLRADVQRLTELIAKFDVLIDSTKEKAKEIRSEYIIIERQALAASRYLKGTASNRRRKASGRKAGIKS
jgi:hypothetical protein